MLSKIKSKLKTIIKDAKIIASRHLFVNRVPMIEENEAYGIAGESDIYDQIVNHVDYVKQGIILTGEKGTFEKDFIVVNQGNIFIVEVKNYKGHIFTEDNPNEWIKHKLDSYTDEIHEKTFKNPLASTLQFCNKLKSTLIQRDESFKSIKIHPIVVFISDHCELDESVRKLNECLIYDDELLQYIKNKKPSKLSKTQMEALYQLRTWDIVYGKNGSQKYGLLQDEPIELIDDQGKLISIMLHEVSEIKRISSNLKTDVIEVSFTNGNKKTYTNQTRGILITLPGNTHHDQSVDFKEIQKIVLGRKKRIINNSRIL
jgi:hypothetical protein